MNGNRHKMAAFKPFANYILSVCQDKNPKLKIAIQAQTRSLAKDKKQLEELMRNNNFFSSMDEVRAYLNIKRAQLFNRFKDMDESEFYTIDSREVMMSLFGKEIEHDITKEELKKILLLKKGVPYERDNRVE